ncbi:MAG: GNAT family N-acetyltransferase [Archangium sp.]
MRMRRTQRLILRHAEDSDAAFIVALLTDPDFIKYIGDRGVKDEASARGYIGKLRDTYASKGFGLYIVTRDSTPIGLCGLVVRDTLPHPDIGFAFLPAARGHGYAKEAALDTLAEADALKLEVLLAICSQDNAPSRKLLESIGFAFQGLTKLKGSDEELCLYRR